MPIPVPKKPVRVRVAPSPTGDPHVGTAYIGLFNLAFARAQGGQFILRIEDTDQKRSTRQSEEAIYRSLRWAGLQWDEGPDIGGEFGPYRQSERSHLYQLHTQQLLESGDAYRCFCTAERMDRVREEQRARKETARYDGFCRQLDPDESDTRALTEPYVIRLKMPQGGETVVPDALRGAVVYDNNQIDDQVLIKTDGLPTYHLANVVDDHLMAITHVIRAEEWLNSTPKHLALYAAFGWEPPVFVHMPLLRNADKSKISKRKNPTSLEYYQRAGILPEALLNFLSLMGYSRKDAAGHDVEKFTFEEFIADLDLMRVSLGGPVFDLQKLDWLNGLYLRAMTPEQLAERVMSFHREDARHAAAGHLVQERVTSLGDYGDHAGAFFRGTLEYGLNARYFVVGAASRKKTAVRLTRAASRLFFEDCLTRLETVADWQGPVIEGQLREACEKAGVAIGDGFMAIRVAAMGRPAAPPLFESLEVLGRALTLARLRQVCGMLADANFLQRTLADTESELAAARAALVDAPPPSTPEASHA
jgi:glutamyl-tRNA synthetase